MIARLPKGKVLKISVKPLNNWVILFVEDSGKGTVMKVVLPRLMPERQKISKEKKRKWQHDKGTDR